MAEPDYVSPSTLADATRRIVELENESKVLRDYVRILHRQVDELMPLAECAGWRGSPHLHRDGEEAREILGLGDDRYPKTRAWKRQCYDLAIKQYRMTLREGEQPVAESVEADSDD